MKWDSLSGNWIEVLRFQPIFSSFFPFSKISEKVLKLVNAKFILDLNQDSTKPH